MEFNSSIRPSIPAISRKIRSVSSEPDNISPNLLSCSSVASRDSSALRKIFLVFANASTAFFVLYLHH